MSSLISTSNLTKPAASASASSAAPTVAGLSPATAAIFSSLRLSLSSVGFHGFQRLFELFSVHPKSISANSFAQLLANGGIQLAIREINLIGRLFPSAENRELICHPDFLSFLQKFGSNSARLLSIQKIFDFLDANKTGRVSIRVLLDSFCFPGLKSFPGSRSLVELRRQFALAIGIKENSPDSHTQLNRNLSLNEFVDYLVGFSVSVPADAVFYSALSGGFGIQLHPTDSILVSTSALIKSRLANNSRPKEFIHSAMRSFEFPDSGLLDAGRFRLALEKAGFPIGNDAAELLFKSIAGNQIKIRPETVANALIDGKTETIPTPATSAVVRGGGSLNARPTNFASHWNSNPRAAVQPVSRSFVSSPAPPPIDLSAFTPDSPLILFIHSPPLGGKSTQITNFLREFPFRSIDPRLLIDKQLKNSNSQINQNNNQNNNKYTNLIQMYLSERQSLPDELLVEIVVEEISLLRSNGNSMFLIEEFPTTMKGWNLLNQEFMRNNKNNNSNRIHRFEKESSAAIPNPLAIFIAVDDKVLLNRNGTSDDYRGLLADYHNHVDPFIKELASTGSVRAVDGNGSIDKVYESLREVISIAKFKTLGQ